MAKKLKRIVRKSKKQKRVALPQPTLASWDYRDCEPVVVQRQK